jgi:hypothetical protein
MSRDISPSFLFVLADRGGFNFCWPVIRDLRGRGVSVMCLLAKKLDQNLRATDNDFGEYTVYDEKIKSLHTLIEQNSFFPQVAIINSLVTRDLEKNLICHLKKINVPIISPIDTWNFFKFRFSPVEKETSGEELRFLPDCVLVVDSYAKEQAIKDGIPEEKLFITGNPHFENLRLIYQQEKVTESVENLRKQWEISSSEKIIVFASEILSKLLQQNIKEYPGYNEVEVLEAIAGVLEKFSRQIFLLIKVHPYEDPTTFLQQPFLQNIRHRICQDLDALVAIKLADMVIGMRSMFLIEASSLGKQTISYQPVDPSEEQFYGNISGMTIPCYDPAQLEKKITQFLEKGSYKEVHSRKLKDSTEEILRFLDNLVF